MASILVVDDEINVANSIRRLLEAHDFKVDVAANGAQALEKVTKSNDIAVVLSDQRMPRMTGSELFKTLSTKFPQIKRILLTGYTDLESIREAVNTGHIFRFLLKPWDDNELIACVEDAFDSYNIYQENERLKSQLEVLNKNLELAVEQKTRVLNMNIRSLERYEKIVEELPIAMICIGSGGMVVLANNKFCTEFSFTSAVEGIPYTRVLPEPLHGLVDAFEANSQQTLHVGEKNFVVNTSQLEIDSIVIGRLFFIQAI